MENDAQLIAEVERAERERCRAVGAEDWEALTALLDDELTHTHMTGRGDDRAALLESLRQRPRTLRRVALHTRIHGDIAVMTGPQYLDLGSGETENQTTQVWRRVEGRWRLLAFHASGDPGALSPGDPAAGQPT